MNLKNLVNNIVSFFTLAVIAALTISIISWIAPGNKVDQKNQDALVEKVVEKIESQPKPSEYPDYDLISYFQSYALAVNQDSFVQKGKILGRVQRTIYPKGKFERMYVYIEASADNGKPLSIYDDVYLTFNNKGGHLPPNESLKTPPSEISRLLYSAEALPYKSLRSSNTQLLNVLEIFNSNQKLGVDIFLSTARPGGKIKLFSIYYECSVGESCEL